MSFTISTCHTFRRFSIFLCQITITPSCTRALLKSRILVIDFKELRNRNLLWTSLYTISAVCTWNGNTCIDNIHCLLYQSAFFLCKWLKFLHIRKVIHHLLITGHARKHHTYIFKTCRIPDCPRCHGTVCVIFFQKFFRLIRYLCQHTTFDRLHYNNILPVFHRSFMTFA